MRCHQQSKCVCKGVSLPLLPLSMYLESMLQWDVFVQAVVHGQRAVLSVYNCAARFDKLQRAPCCHCRQWFCVFMRLVSCRLQEGRKCEVCKMPAPLKCGRCKEVRRSESMLLDARCAHSVKADHRASATCKAACQVVKRSCPASASCHYMG